MVFGGVTETKSKVLLQVQPYILQVLIYKKSESSQNTF